VPAHDSVRLHDDQGRAPIPPRAGKYDPKQSISVAEVGTRDCALEHGQLVTECQVLERDRPVTTADQRKGPEQDNKRGQHESSCGVIDHRINRRRWRSGSGERQYRGRPRVGRLDRGAACALRHRQCREYRLGYSGSPRKRSTCSPLAPRVLSPRGRPLPRVEPTVTSRTRLST